MFLITFIWLTWRAMKNRPTEDSGHEAPTSLNGHVVLKTRLGANMGVKGSGDISGRLTSAPCKLPQLPHFQMRAIRNTFEILNHLSKFSKFPLQKWKAG